MIFNKNNQAIKEFKLSDEAIAYLKKYIIPEMNITEPLTMDVLDNIVSLSVEWELNMIDPNSESGSDKTYDYPEKERNEMADKFVGEVTGQWKDDECIPDLEDINIKLKLK